MSETMIYQCPNTLETVVFDSNENYCPHCKKPHEYPNAISRKKDDKWHKTKNMWIDKNRANKNKYTGK